MLSRRETEKVSDELHRVDIVLPKLEAAREELDRDRLVVGMLVVGQKVRNRVGYVLERAGIRVSTLLRKDRLRTLRKEA